MDARGQAGGLDKLLKQMAVDAWTLYFYIFKVCVCVLEKASTELWESPDGKPHPRPATVHKPE